MKILEIILCTVFSLDATKGFDFGFGPKHGQGPGFGQGTGRGPNGFGSLGSGPSFNAGMNVRVASVNGWKPGNARGPSFNQPSRWSNVGRNRPTGWPNSFDNRGRGPKNTRKMPNPWFNSNSRWSPDSMRNPSWNQPSPVRNGRNSAERSPWNRNRTPTNWDRPGQSWHGQSPAWGNRDNPWDRRSDRNRRRLESAEWQGPERPRWPITSSRPTSPWAKSGPMSPRQPRPSPSMPTKFPGRWPDSSRRPPFPGTQFPIRPIGGWPDGPEMPIPGRRPNPSRFPGPSPFPPSWSEPGPIRPLPMRPNPGNGPLFPPELPPIPPPPSPRIQISQKKKNYLKNNQWLLLPDRLVPPSQPMSLPPPTPQSFQEPPPPTIMFQLPPPTRQVLFTSVPRVRHPTFSLRQAIEQAEIRTHQLIDPSPFVAQTIHQRLDMMHNLKQMLFDAAGIGQSISAPDDGTFWTDLLLTEDQSMYLINRMNMWGRKKRYAVFLEGFPAYKWDMARPVPYTFDANVASHERTIVHTALKQIEARTCIRFQYYPTKPSSNYIYYTKMVNPALCGLSYIGRTAPANPVYLSFSCPDFPGVIIHETMHALGVNHHHQRSDRDKYIRINWENIDPTKYDYFAVADPTVFTTYGVPYDYYSIMAYSPKIGTLPPYTRPSVTPLRNPNLYLPYIGQRRFLSNGDAELLDKMYYCVDRNIYCGAWANLNLCRAPAQYGWMLNNCQKSCGFC